jgi:murein DD-endopeptidase MepM/ murein hydrolase activator NlpD
MRGYAHRVAAAAACLALAVAVAIVSWRPAPTPAWAADVARGPSAVLPFGWPLDPVPRVVRAFDPPAQAWLPGHRGVDLASTPGARVYAAGGGVVRFAGLIAGRGAVSVEHRGGLRTTYEPVEPTVRTGDRVAGGDPIGRLAAGHPGCAASACLHWGLRRGAEYLDPLGLLALGRVRLLPLSG